MGLYPEKASGLQSILHQQDKFTNRKVFWKVETINSRIREDVVVLKDTQFNDLLSENITVAEGITARIYGIIKKKLVVEKNAVVYLHGKVLGEIINNGGTVYVFGPSGTVTTF